LIAAVVAVFIAATKALTEVIVVVAPVYVITTVAVVCVLVGIRVFVIRTPMVFPVGLAGAETFIVAIVHRLPQRLRAVFVRFIVLAAAIVSIGRRRVKIRVTIVIEAIVPEMDLLLPYALLILFLKTILRQALLLL